MFNFKDQNIIVTGGTRGIGRAISSAFLEAGGKVIATYRSDEKGASEFLRLHEKYKDNIDLKRFDVSSSKDCEKFYQYIDEKYESIHVLVNNSGIRRDSVLAMMPEDDWELVLNTNLSGSFRMCKKAVMKMMQNRYGRIINITSPSGKFGFAGQANYAASKAGQVALTKSLSKEVATRGITVNCVSPGFIETEFIEDLTEKQKKEYTDTIPVKKFGKPEDVSSSVLFLASKEASYITGTTLEVTGGL